MFICAQWKESIFQQLIDNQLVMKEKGGFLSRSSAFIIFQKVKRVVGVGSKNQFKIKMSQHEGSKIQRYPGHGEAIL